MWLLVAFVAIPLIEIALFIQIGGFIGLWPTLLVVILTAMLGTYLVQSQGRMAIENLRTSFARMDDPSEPLAHGAMILISGALLLTPGFFTDAVGFALLMPPVRQAVFQWARKRVVVSSFEMGTQAHHRPTHYPPASHDIIDGEFTETGDPKQTDQDGSGWTKH